MTELSIPGVFIEEIPQLPPAVREVDSAVPAFIGYTEMAKELLADDLLFSPKLINSFAEYQHYFGAPGDPLHFILYHSIRSYFDNGGGDCYVISVGGYTQGLKKEDLIKGLDVAAKKDEPTLLVFPDAVNLPGNELYEVQQAALKQASELGDRFCILDVKYANTKAAHDAVISEFRRNTGTDHLTYSAAYTPHLKLTTGEIVPASGAVAGIYCQVDKTRGVWKPPANISLNGVNDVAYPITSTEQDGLNIDATAGKSINPIWKFPGRGILIWGSRTLAGNDNEWRYVPVRRFYNMVEESIKRSCEPFVFEPNDADTWIKIKGMIENYLILKWRDGALQGAKPEHAYYVNVGLGQTMTAADVMEGRLIVEVGMAPIKPAEFIILRIFQKQLQG